MAITRVPNRYIARSDLIALLNKLFPGEQYKISEYDDAWIVTDSSRQLNELLPLPTYVILQKIYAHLLNRSQLYAYPLYWCDFDNHGIERQLHVSWPGIIMSVLRPIDECQQRMNRLRVQNHNVRKFIPERDFRSVLSRELVNNILSAFVPLYNLSEVLEFTLEDAPKVFGILVLINRADCIDRFIRNDQLQTRHVDSLLPFAEERLQQILGDVYIAEQFHEKQWEFCAPVFSGKVIPRKLPHQTILPFLHERFLTSGGYGQVYELEIHPSHRPPSYEGERHFVRKELELGDQSFENEVRVLSALQRLKHPNILELIGCYTLDSRNNLISPYVAGGTLRTFLTQELPSRFSLEEVIYSMAGLASAVWALHEFSLDDTEPSHKGHHQDLRQDNILCDGTRFILADFGLSSIKPIDAFTKTPFKGRKGYCQAPECAQLESPYSEHVTTRASDIFALACIFADVVVHYVRGPVGVEEFEDARKFYKPPMCYRLYHKGPSSNDAVATMLQKITQEDGSKAMQDLGALLGTMLKLAPSQRPSAVGVTASLCMSTVAAFDCCLTSLYERFETHTDALIEKERFKSWVWSQDPDLYTRSAGATTASKVFGSIVEILRQLKVELESIATNQHDIDGLSFLEVRTLNTQLLNSLSPERGVNSRSRLRSQLLGKLTEQKIVAKFPTTASADSNSLIAQKAETKHLVARVEEATLPVADPPFRMISDPIVDVRGAGRFAVANIRLPDRDKPVILESIGYQDPYRQQKLRPRVYALCELISCGTVGHDPLKLPPFYGLHENNDQMCFDIVYGFPRNDLVGPGRTSLMSLHDLLIDREGSSFPSWETRCSLARDLAESLGSFHDVNWYHKDLTASSILFFPSRNCSPSTRASRPYLLGFHHSREAIDDFTEGPLQDRKHQRYHHPNYISACDRRYAGFRPEFDYYSLGILLIEIGLWLTIDMAMEEHNTLNNHAFSTTLMKHKVPLLSFQMGSWYEDVVRDCLTASSQVSESDLNGSDLNPLVNDLFAKKVIMPLRARSGPTLTSELTRKREREFDDTQDYSDTLRRRIN